MLSRLACPRLRPIVESIEPRTLLAAADSWLFAIDDGRSDNSSTLFRIDTATGQTHKIGETGVGAMTDIAFASDGTLYGINSKSLYRINAKTAATTRVGTIGFTRVNALVENFATGELAAATSTREFLAIDPATGRGRLVNFLSSGLFSQGDFANSPDGVMYGTAGDFEGNSHLITVDPSFGRATIVKELPFAQVNSLELSPGGQLFASAGGASGGSLSSQLIVIDPSTGNSSAVATIQGVDPVQGFAAPIGTGAVVRSPDSRTVRVFGSGNADRVVPKVVGGKLHVILNGVTRKFQRSAIRSLAINCGNGNDIVTVEGAVRGANVSGENGNDKLYGGDDADTLLGGNGKDYLVGNAGNDLIRGGSHNDRAFGNNGDDRLYGDNHNDALEGGADADRLEGGSGADTFLAKDGVIDTLVGIDGSPDDRRDTNDVLA
jgi:Ca2+-binding RTX toxin-like protein